MLVRGGPANSGTKQPKRERHPDWTCRNGHTNRGYAIVCLTTGCRQKRRHA